MDPASTPTKDNKVDPASTPTKGNKEALDSTHKYGGKAYSCITKYWFNTIFTFLFQLTLTAFVLSTRISSQVHTNLEIAVLIWCFLVLFDYVIERWAGEMAQLDRCRKVDEEGKSRLLFLSKKFLFLYHRNDLWNSLMFCFVLILSVFLILAPISRYFIFHIGTNCIF